MRILLVLEYFWPQVGGVETLFLELAQGLVQRGHSVVVLTTRLTGTPAFERHEGIEIHRIGNPDRPSRYRFTLAATPLACRLARQADLVHTTTYNAALPAWIAARWTRRPVAITVHELIGATCTRSPAPAGPRPGSFACSNWPACAFHSTSTSACRGPPATH